MTARCKLQSSIDSLSQKLDDEMRKSPRNHANIGRLEAKRNSLAISLSRVKKK